MVKYIDSDNVIYDITLVTNHEDPLALAGKLSNYAEVDYLDRRSGTVRLRLISSAGSDYILKMCDDFKIEVEADGDTRLTYKVASILL